MLCSFSSGSRGPTLVAAAVVQPSQLISTANRLHLRGGFPLLTSDPSIHGSSPREEHRAAKLSLFKLNHQIILPLKLKKNPPNIWNICFQLWTVHSSEQQIKARVLNHRGNPASSPPPPPLSCHFSSCCSSASQRSSNYQNAPTGQLAPG